MFYRNSACGGVSCSPSKGDDAADSSDSDYDTGSEDEANGCEDALMPEGAAPEDVYVARYSL